MEESNYISAGSERLHYLKWGYGRRLLLAFHGYGNDAHIFDIFRSHLESDYTVLSFDLPHHGSSNWPADAILRRAQFIEAVQELMRRYDVTKISLLGYSMGCRLCLTLAELLPQHINKVVLMAADGLSTNKAYYFCTRTSLGRRMFRSTLQHPTGAVGLADWLKKIEAIDEARHKYLMRYIGAPAGRQFLLRAWPAVREFIPSQARLKKAIREHRISITIIMGATDKVMPPKLAERFKQGLGTVSVVIFDKGHRVFDGSNAREIAQHLL
jgi:pimeloyl-ACP methyl ester carboxylesterase